MWLFVAKFTHQCFGEGVLNQHCLVATKCQLATHTTLSPLWRDLNVQGARPSKKKVWGWDCLETALNQDDIATTNGNTMVSSKKATKCRATVAFFAQINTTDFAIWIMFMIIVVVLFVLSWSEMAEMLTRSYLVIVGVANATQLCHLDGLSSTRVATQRGTILNCSAIIRIITIIISGTNMISSSKDMMIMEQGVRKNLARPLTHWYDELIVHHSACIQCKHFVIQAGESSAAQGINMYKCSSDKKT